MAFCNNWESPTKIGNRILRINYVSTRVGLTIMAKYYLEYNIVVLIIIFRKTAFCNILIIF